LEKEVGELLRSPDTKHSILRARMRQRFGDETGPRGGKFLAARHVVKTTRKKKRRGE